MISECSLRDGSDFPEWCSDQILRVLDLPAEVIAEKAKAKNGVLELEMPKAARSKEIHLEPKTAYLEGPDEVTGASPTSHGCLSARRSAAPMLAAPTRELHLYSVAMPGSIPL